MEPQPQPIRPNFEGMGNRPFESRSSRYDDMTAFMDFERIDFTGTSTQPQQEIRRNAPRVRRGRGCNTTGRYRVPGDN